MVKIVKQLIYLNCLYIFQNNKRQRVRFLIRKYLSKRALSSELFYFFSLPLRMNILLIEPFFSGSHRRWSEELKTFSSHNISILSLPGKHWKWRMYGGAVSLAKQFNALEKLPDALLVSDMLDLTTFLSLTRKRTSNLPVYLYFHENQITYPWSPSDADVPLQRNNQYGFLNYTSALAADKVFFNSEYHKASFLGALPDFLRQFPDRREMANVDLITKKSELLYLGMNLKKFDKFNKVESNEKPVLLWNHRWEYDKNPESFFNALFKLKAEGIQFQLIITGENYKSSPAIFMQAKERLKEEIIHFGYADKFETYAELLQKADILPVTNNQDFFGGSVVEAIYCDCFPLLPKRLAYLEHIPEHLHNVHLYENEEGFYLKLKRIVLGLLNFEKSDFRRFVAHYDWENLIAHYDDVFSK